MSKFTKIKPIIFIALSSLISLSAHADEAIRVAIKTSIHKFENAGPYSEDIGLTQKLLYSNIKKSLERKGYRVVGSSTDATDGLTFSVDMHYGQNCCGSGAGSHGYAISVGNFILGNGSFDLIPSTKEVVLAWGSGISAAGGPGANQDKFTRDGALKIVDDFINSKF